MKLRIFLPHPFRLPVPWFRLLSKISDLDLTGKIFQSARRGPDGWAIRLGNAAMYNHEEVARGAPGALVNFDQRC